MPAPTLEPESDVAADSGYGSVPTPQTVNSQWEDFTDADILNRVTVAAIGAGGAGSAVSGAGYQWAMAGATDGVVVCLDVTPCTLAAGHSAQLFARGKYSATTQKILAGLVPKGTANPFTAVADGVWVEKAASSTDALVKLSVGSSISTLATITSAFVVGAFNEIRLEASVSREGSKVAFRAHVNGKSSGWVTADSVSSGPYCLLMAAYAAGNMICHSAGRITENHADN